METKYKIGDPMFFQNCAGTVKKIEERGGKIRYYCDVGILPMWIPEDQIETSYVKDKPLPFHKMAPHLLIADKFYCDPDKIRAFALEQDYTTNQRHYKGKRTNERFLWPFMKEEFERLLGRNVVDWTAQPCNGCFQITGFNDPLVWHSDLQSYAAAIYLTPNAPVSAGTSFWRDNKFQCRRPPSHPLEFDRFRSDEERMKIHGEVYNGYNITHPDNWELVDKVGAVYNRLVIWDAQLIHSASSYAGLESDSIEKARLVQLFFFTIEAK